MPSQLLDALGSTSETDAGLKDYRHRDFAGTRHQGLEISNADFSYATLDGADWPDAVLKSVTCYQASLDRMNIAGACLTRVNLTEASMERSCLSGARLSGWTTLLYTVLRGADLSEAHLVEMVTINNSDLAATTCANLRANVVRVAQSSFVEAKLPQANLEAFTFTECDFQGADLTNAVLRRGAIEGCNFTEADLRGTVWETVRWNSSCRFDGARIAGAAMPRDLMKRALAAGAVQS